MDFDNSAPVPNDGAMFHIGAVAELTGLKPETIRVWERRYHAVRPRRSQGGTRQFSESDVVRLRMLRALCDFDFSIGAIAHLDDDALRRKLAMQVSRRRQIRDERSVRVAILHPNLAERLSSDEGSEVQVVASADALNPLVDASAKLDVDVLVAALPLLGADPLASIAQLRQQLGVHSAVVLYHFASNDLLAQFVAANVRIIQAPVRTTALVQGVIDQATIERLRSEMHLEPAGGARSEPTQRRFSDAALAKLRELSTDVECDCPNHLSQLASALVAFEAYCEQCESTQPEDAEFHAYLHRGTSRARAHVEELLSHALEHSGVRVDVE